MNNKNLAILLVILILAAAAVYFFVTTQNAIAPTTQQLENEVEQESTDDYIGKTTAQAQAQAQANEVAFRVIERDGESLARHDDFQKGRINATVENGVVTAYVTDTELNAIETHKSEQVQDADYDRLIGLTTAQAEAFAAENNIDFRIISVDGEIRPATLDYRPGRVSVEVEDGVVVTYSVE